jgi:hypothetical protein
MKVHLFARSMENIKRNLIANARDIILVKIVLSVLRALLKTLVGSAVKTVVVRPTEEKKTVKVMESASKKATSQNATVNQDLPLMV